VYLKQFVFINWGNIPNLEFDFGPINLFSGGNGSGKTTAADAIQTIMTAAHENLFHFNPGQDETTQRGRGGKRVRTLSSYVLGCDDGSYARLDPTDGYLAAIFHPTQGEKGEPFTALIGVRAWLDQAGNQPAARQDDVLFMILPGLELTLSHFVREEKVGKYIAPLDKIQTLLITEFGKRRVEKYDTKKSYLRRLYGVLRGRNDSVTEQEAVAAAKAFSRFMAYKPVQGINRFVADEILEKRDLGEAIRSISSQLKTIHGMEREASRLIESINILECSKQQGQRYIEQWIELNVIDYTLAQYHYLQRQQDYLKAKQQQQNFQQELEGTGSEIGLVTDRRRQVHEQRVALEAQRMGIGALQQKDEIQQQREQQQQALTEQAKQLLLQDNQLQQNIEQSRVISKGLQAAVLATDLPAVANLNSAALCRKLLEQGGREKMDFQSLLSGDILGDLSPLEQHLDQVRIAQRLHNQWTDHWYAQVEGEGGQNLRDQLAGLHHQRHNRYNQLAERHRRKQHEIERLESHHVNYPHYVERALAEISSQCPQADPRVLCDHIEVKDPRWQAAIEGYLGGARFSIIVEPKYEAEAIRIVRNMPGRDNRARIIQGEKAYRDAERLRLDADSILHVLTFSHAVAQSYVTASYGGVLRVESSEALRHTRRGITPDGMGAGNYSMFRCDLPDAELVFGTAARERALQAKKEELEQQAIEWQQANDLMQETARLLSAVDGLKLLNYADTITNMLSIHREMQKLERLYEQLDLTEFNELESKLEELREQEEQYAKQERNLNKQEGELGEKLREIIEQTKKQSKQQEETQAQVEQCDELLRTLASDWTEFDCDARLNLADHEAKDLNLEIAQANRKEAEGQRRASERKMDDAILNHNQSCRPVDAIVYQSFDGEYDIRLFRSICELQRDIDRVYNQLKNNILVEKHQQLSQLKESFNSAFVTHLCHAIHQAINDGKRQIKQLNQELQHHRFGDDLETFRFDSDWIPEYRGYARFFEEVIKNPTLGDGATLFSAELSKRSIQVRDELMSMLLDEDEQKALRELERIADYRNYRKYEIYKEVEGKPPIALSEYGTGSGGQLETPAYIIRSAAITSAFRFAESGNHLRMVLVDEAFSKMDETRSREVINYLTESLGLQLVFIMPTSKCGPFMDLISNEFVFAKCPSDKPRGQLMTRVLVDRKECNQEKIKELWANHRQSIYQQAELDFMDGVV